MSLKFEWNPNKAKKNKDKHGISFDEAVTVFSDPLSMTYDDPDHSYDENRYIIIVCPISAICCLFPIRKWMLKLES